MGASGLDAMARVNARLAAIDAAERQPRVITGVRVRDLAAEERARLERLLLESGFA